MWYSADASFMFKKTTFNCKMAGNKRQKQRENECTLQWSCFCQRCELRNEERKKKHRENCDCNFKRNDSTFCFEMYFACEKKKPSDVEEYFIVIITSSTWFHTYFFITMNIFTSQWIFFVFMFVSIAMHQYLSATLLRYLETWISHQKHFKMNCFIGIELKSGYILETVTLHRCEFEWPQRQMP